MSNVSITALRSMSIAGIGAKPKTCINNGNKPVYMGRIFGEITDIKYKEDRNGKMGAQFIGEFRGVNAAGEQFESQRLYLPGTIGEGLEGLMKTAEGKPVQFAFDIIASESEKSPVGYAYGVKQLVKTATSDRMAELAAQMDQVETPVVTAKKAAAPAAKKDKDK